MALAELRERTAERWPYAELFTHAGIRWEPFPRLIVPSDVDGMVHIRESNRFLFLEGKRVGEREISSAQRETLEGLAQHGHDVLCFWADDLIITALEHVGHDPCRRSATNQDLISFCRAWGAWAQAQPAPTARLSGFSFA